MNKKSFPRLGDDLLKFCAFAFCSLMLSEKMDCNLNIEELLMQINAPSEILLIQCNLQKYVPIYIVALTSYLHFFSIFASYLFYGSFPPHCTEGRLPKE